MPAPKVASIAKARRKRGKRVKEVFARVQAEQAAERRANPPDALLQVRHRLRRLRRQVELLTDFVENLTKEWA